MRHIVTITLLVVAVIHLLPLSGVLGGARLESLYGIAIDEPDLAILMRHRAVLFGLLGGFLLVAAFKRAFQPMGFVAGFASVLSFLWLAWSEGGYNAAINRVVVADIVALACLAIGLAAWFIAERRAPLSAVAKLQ